MAIADFFFTFGMFFILRLSMLYAYNIIKARKEFKSRVQNVLVYGIGNKSVALISRFANSTHNNIVGFIQYGDTDVNHFQRHSTNFLSLKPRFDPLFPYIYLLCPIQQQVLVRICYFLLPKLLQQPCTLRFHS